MKKKNNFGVTKPTIKKVLSLSLCPALQLLDPEGFKSVVKHYRRQLPELLHIAARQVKQTATGTAQVRSD